MIQKDINISINSFNAVVNTTQDMLSRQPDLVHKFTVVGLLSYMIGRPSSVVNTKEDFAHDHSGRSFDVAFLQKSTRISSDRPLE
jgi:hypothetical protein